jgi:peptide/nickel transport system substrate-binding protein
MLIKKFKKRKALALLSAGLVAFTSVGVSNSANAIDAVDKSKTSLTFSMFQDPGRLDVVSQPATSLIIWLPGNVYEPLVSFDAQDKPSPAVAKSWSTSPDGKVWKFQIDPARKFSDGTKITANDVVYSLNQFQNGPVLAYKGPFANVSSIKATKKDEVSITLTAKSRNFFRGMGTISGLVMPASSDGKRNSQVVGSGPYVISEYVPGSHMQFSYNKMYSGTKPQITSARVRFITDSPASLLALRAGEVDGLPLTSSAIWPRIISEGYGQDFRRTLKPAAGELHWLMLNQNQAPYNNPVFRQAIAQIVDRDAYVTGLGAPKGAMVPQCGWGIMTARTFKRASNETCVIDRDVKKAMASLKAAGLDTFPIEFVGLTDVPALRLAADIITQQLRSAGLTVNRRDIPLAQYSSTIFNARPPQYGMSLMGGSGTLSDFVCKDAALYGYQTYCSAGYTKLMQQADRALTDADYLKLITEANDLLQKDAVVVPLLARTGLGLYTKKLVGWKPPTIRVEVALTNFYWTK